MFRIGHLALLLAAGSNALLAQGHPAEQVLAMEDHHQVMEDGPRTWPPVGPKGRAITDNARLRTEAMRQWWGEWTPEFRTFLQNAAASERGRHLNLMPKMAEEGIIQAAAPAVGNWINIGPTKADVIKNGGTSLAKTDSGRPRTILVDPTNNQVLYLCTAGGGVWKTVNGGSSWTPITDSLGTLSCGYLAMDPVDSQTLYLGLGDPFDGTGLGIVKSTDGGVTWSAPQTLGTSRTIQSVVVSSNNRNIVMVATNTGLFRSTDAGQTYTQVASINAAWKCWDLAWAGGSNYVLTAETDLANADGNTAGKIYRSTDEGATWTATTGVNSLATRISVASAPSNRSTLFAMAGKTNATAPASDLQGVYKSTDGGATWTLVTSPAANFLGGQSFYNHMIVIDRTNPSVVYLGGQLAMIKSTNGGSTWTTMTDWLAQNGKPYVHADFHCGAQDSNGNLFVGTDGGIFKSADGGVTFSDTPNIGITTHMIYSVGSSPAAPDAVIGGFQDNGTRVRSGATTTFNQYIGGDGFGSLMHPVNGSTMLGSLYYTRIQKSTNGGTTFTSAVTGITESNNTSSAPFITRLADGPADATGNTVYTYVNAKVYKSTNYAGSWTAMGTSGLPTTSFYIRNVAAAKSNGQVVGIVANGGKVYLTSNGGSSWTTAAALPNNGSYTSSIAFDPTDYNTVYTSSVAPDATKSHLWKSSNLGGSWTAIDGGGFPAGVPVGIVKVDPSDRNIVYAGTHLGLYRSSDGGATWARWGNGLPLVNIMDLYISPDGSIVRVATYGRGFWELRGTTTITAPSITTQPANQTVTVGQTGTFSVVASGTAPLAYQWYRGTTQISGATAASYTTAATTTADNNATFYVSVSNSAGNVNSASASLTVSNVVDTTAPTVSATESGTSGTITLSATATDTVGVTRVEFYVDGALKGTDTTSPYTMALDSTTLADGAHTLVAKAYDAAGNMGTSTAVNFTVNNTITTETERIVNGGFEVGTTPWTGTTAVIGTWSTQPAFEGTRNAWMGGKGKKTTQALYQSVTIPSTVITATVSFQLHIDTKETTTATAYDKLAVQILSSTGTVLKTLATYSNLNKATGYALRTFDVSAYKGQTIRLNFKMTEDSSLQSSFTLDKVSLITK